MAGRLAAGCGRRRVAHVRGMQPPHGRYEDTEESAAQLREQLAAARAELARVRADTGFGLTFTRPQPGSDGEEQSVARLRSGVVPLLRDEPDWAVDSGTEGAAHLLIEGDNLDALVALERTHRNSIDLIYIDPPYNTGNTGGDLIYDDHRVDAEDPWRHSKWLSFMEPRLQFARRLLARHGVLMISIDDNEQAHLRMLADEIFGERNFLAQLVWTGPRKGNSRFVQVKHDYILMYARHRQVLADKGPPFKERKAGIDKTNEEIATLRRRHGDDHAAASAALAAWMASQTDLTSGVSSYRHIDERGAYAIYPLIAPRGGNKFDILHPDTGQPCRLPERGWSVSPGRAEELRAAGRLVFGDDHRSTVYQKFYLAEHEWQDPLAVFEQDRSRAAGELRRLLGRKAFDFPKDSDVLARWIGIVGGPDATVLDFFAGSASTGHAVAKLNAADGGSRRAILVTNDEKKICREVAWPRMRAALTGHRPGRSDEAPLGGRLRMATIAHLAPGGDPDARADRAVDAGTAEVPVAFNALELLAAGDGWRVWAGPARVAVEVADPLAAGDAWEAVAALDDDRVRSPQAARVCVVATYAGTPPQVLQDGGQWHGWDVRDHPAARAATNKG